MIFYYIMGRGAFASGILPRGRRPAGKSSIPLRATRAVLTKNQKNYYYVEQNQKRKLLINGNKLLGVLWGRRWVTP